MKLLDLQKTQIRPRKPLKLKWSLPKINSYFLLLIQKIQFINRQKLFKLSDIQAKSILEIRLSRLTNLERSKLSEDLHECIKMIEDYLEILSSSKRLNSVLINELNEINSKIDSSSRKTEISDSEEIIDDESLITSEDVVVTLTNTGYIKEYL